MLGPPACCLLHVLSALLCPPHLTTPARPLSCRLAEQARAAEKARREAAVKAAEYEKTAKEELDLFVAQRAAAKKVSAAQQCAQSPCCAVLCWRMHTAFNYA
jgi:hypothetical protein